MIADWALYCVAVLFLGGADDREALSVVARMAEHPKIDLTMVRLLKDGEVTGEDGSERKLDNELVSEFRVITAGNHRVVYIEEVVVDGSGTVAVIRSVTNFSWWEDTMMNSPHSQQGLQIGTNIQIWEQLERCWLPRNSDEWGENQTKL